MLHDTLSDYYTGANNLGCLKKIHKCFDNNKLSLIVIVVFPTFQNLCNNDLDSIAKIKKIAQTNHTS